MRPLDKMGTYSRKSDKPCPQCGRLTVTCTFDDGLPCIGDQTFTFSHKCSHCDHRQFARHHIGHGYDTHNDYECDFCGWNWLSRLP